MESLLSTVNSSAEFFNDLVEDATVDLSAEQDEAREQIIAWLTGPEREFRLGGYAGTGKTTLIKRLVAELGSTHSIAIAAFTGKAVAVLRRKGVGRAMTLHGLLYHADYDSIQKKMIWTPRRCLPYDLIIVDEASMVSTQLYNDLLRHEAKLLFVGDPAQLEPVGDNPNLMRECSYTLRNIHRQAKKSPILRLARAVREDTLACFPQGEWGDEVNGRLTVTDSIYGLDLANYDVVVCARNATRHALNARRRAELGRAEVPSAGESVICLANSRDTGLFNGLMLEIERINEATTFGAHDGFYANLSDDTGDEYNDVPILSEFFGKDYKRDWSMRNLRAIPFDYGYCLTAHKSQGSEWDRVLVLDEPLFNVDRSRWRYTAITRAIKELTYVLA